MPITDYSFQDRIFFAKETGTITAEDAQEWADKLAEAAQASPLPIVALVDAMQIGSLGSTAARIFERASYTDNLLAVVVATHAGAALTSRTIGLLGRRGGTIVLATLDAARERAELLLREAEQE